MKIYLSIFFGAHTSLFATIILSVLIVAATSLRLTPTINITESYTNGGSSSNGDQAHVIPPKEEAKEEAGLMELYPTGSSLPDCSHACGPCFPCKRVMVSFQCSIAESCPVVYRCMCKGRYYPVPSN